MMTSWEPERAFTRPQRMFLIVGALAVAEVVLALWLWRWLSG